jgi:NADH dehydrogenase FAD-containing subunit
VGCCIANWIVTPAYSLQVEGFDNIFAVGDVANTAEVKMGYYAGLQFGQ